MRCSQRNKSSLKDNRNQVQCTIQNGNFVHGTFPKINVQRGSSEEIFAL